MRVLHVIDSIGAGGPARSLAASIEHGRAPGSSLHHAIIALRKPAYPPLLFALRRLGAELQWAPGDAATACAIEASDVVLVHFWNTPEIWRFLSTEWPPWRLVYWMQMLGAHPPQLFHPEMLRRAHDIVFTAPPDPATAPIEGIPAVIPGIADFSRLQGLKKRDHDGFNVLYLGSGNPGKLHPRFLGIMSRIDIPNLRIVMCGGDFDRSLREPAAGLAHAGRIQIIGFREDIRSVFETADVFGYPLSPRTYATSDKSLQEAMMAGVPAVIFRHGGPSRFVEHEATGLIADTEDQFARFVERLHEDPRERRRLGENAREYALANFSPARPAGQLMSRLAAVCALPKRRNPACQWPLPSRVIPAASFLLSIGWERSRVTSGLAGWILEGNQPLDRAISELPDDVFMVEGGLIHWRNAHPDDPALRFWAAIWLLKSGNYSAAAGEFTAAAAIGAPGPPCRMLRRVADALDGGFSGPTDQEERLAMGKLLRGMALPHLAGRLLRGARADGTRA